MKAEVENIQRKYRPSYVKQVPYQWQRLPKKPTIPDVPCPLTLSILGITFNADKHEDAPDQETFIEGTCFAEDIVGADTGAWAVGR